MSKPKAILLFGAPGVGKGTIGAMLNNASSNYHLSTGDIFRSLDKASELGKLFGSYANEGKLVPDDVTLKIFWGHVEDLMRDGKFDPANQFIFLDGMPRTTGQAEVLDNYVDVVQVISFQVTDDEEIFRRLAKRAVIEGRSDDADKTIVMNRLAQYREKTQMVLDHYPQEIIKEFNAQQKPVEVLFDVLKGTIDVLKHTPATLG